MLKGFETAIGANEGLLAYLAEDDLLRVETHHRLMNTFMILSALLQREYSAAGPCGRSALGRSINVVRAHADLHRLLAGRDRGRDVDAPSHMTALCKALSDAVLAPQGVRCEIVTEPGVLSGAQCEWLGLAICELVLNAAKHAFVDGVPGIVHVALSRTPAGWRCAVVDNGQGAKADVAPGLGVRIVNALVARLNGAITSRSGPSGYAVAIDFPMAIDDFGSEA